MPITLTAKSDKTAAEENAKWRYNVYVRQSKMNYTNEE